jgi:acetolactate synthase-1/2/3 large subunit
VAKALADEGVPFTFGIPGTHNIELYDALAASDRVRPILVTDEQSASFMADAVWRASGRLGCVSVVPGAGLTHALSGIAEAFLDTIPMLVLACGIRRDSGFGYQLHDVDQLAIARPVTKAALRVERGEEIYATVRRACALAREGVPGPVMVEVPADLYLFKHDFVAGAGRRDEMSAVTGIDEDVDRALELLSAGRRVLLYLGLGAAAAGRDLVALAQRLEAPVATTFQGKGVFPETHPLFLWPGFGDAAPAFVRRIVAECEATLAIGCRFGEVATASYGIVPPRPFVHVDIDPTALGRNFPPDLGIVASSARFVEALLARAAPREPDAELRHRIAEGHAGVWREWEKDKSASGVTPAILLRSLQAALGPETVFTTDSGNGTFLAAECLRLDGPNRFLAPVDYSCMGYAVPAAIGAKLARPEVPVVALAGDGAFLMTGLELLTAVNESAPVMVFVLRDGELAQIAQFQQVALGRKVCSELADYDLVSICRGLGVECLSLAADREIDATLDRACQAAREGRPVVVDVAVDYSKKTFFTRGVVKTNFLRLPWRDRLRIAGRALTRRLVGA